MAWENRNGSRYYYQKRREGGRVVSRYVGAGALADLMAQIDEIDRERQALEREHWQASQAEEAAIDKEIAEYSRLLRQFTAAVLLASGCHQHRRQWRVKRERKADSKE
jgi:hypothetical protein